MFQSDRELPPCIHCVAYFKFEDICEDLGESTASMVQHRELCDNYSASGIRLNSFLLQLHILTILAIPKSCIRSPSCQLLLLSIPVWLQTQRAERENLSQLACGHQTTVTTCATSRLQINQSMRVAYIYIYI